jgi:hypothetical protein
MVLVGCAGDGTQQGWLDVYAIDCELAFCLTLTNHPLNQQF